jgi:hypothetical protein
MPRVENEQQKSDAFRKATLLDLSIVEIDDRRGDELRGTWLRHQVADVLANAAIQGFIESPLGSDVIDLSVRAITELISNADGQAPQTVGRRRQRQITRASVAIRENIETHEREVRLEVGDNEPDVSKDGRGQTTLLGPDEAPDLMNTRRNKGDAILDALEPSGLGRAMLLDEGVILGFETLQSEEPDGTAKIASARVPIPPVAFHDLVA